MIGLSFFRKIQQLSPFCGDGVCLTLPVKGELKRERRICQARILLIGQGMFALNPENCLKEIMCFSLLIKLNYIMRILSCEHRQTSESTVLRSQN